MGYTELAQRVDRLEIELNELHRQLRGIIESPDPAPPPSPATDEAAKWAPLAKRVYLRFAKDMIPNPTPVETLFANSEISRDWWIGLVKYAVDEAVPLGLAAPDRNPLVTKVTDEMVEIALRKHKEHYRMTPPSRTVIRRMLEAALVNAVWNAAPADRAGIASEVTEAMLNVAADAYISSRSTELIYFDRLAMRRALEAALAASWRGQEES